MQLTKSSVAEAAKHAKLVNNMKYAGGGLILLGLQCKATPATRNCSQDPTNTNHYLANSTCSFSGSLGGSFGAGWLAAALIGPAPFQSAICIAGVAGGILCSWLGRKGADKLCPAIATAHTVANEGPPTTCISRESL